jgi:Glycosyl hydrolases family 32 N-terminal domain
MTVDFDKDRPGGRAVLASSFWFAILLGVMAMALSDVVVGAEPEGKTFQPEGMWIWDNWFVQEGARWHAFYLELPKAVGLERRWTGNDFYKHVGHAISEDLVTWHDAGPALVALSGTWNDRHIATGSIIKHDSRWWMFFTGRGQKGDGVGLAVSDDLMTWKTEPQPLFPLIGGGATESSAGFESPWEGQTQRWAGISDPFIYPGPVDGWFYLALCARVLGAPIEQSGCVALVRSRDLRAWESAGIVAWPHCFERMETPQFWQREGRWYLSFGGVLNKPWVEKNQDHLPAPARGKTSHRNYCYAMSDFRQPIRSEQMHYVDIPSANYIMKVLTDADGRDLAFFTKTEARGSCLSAA